MRYKQTLLEGRFLHKVERFLAKVRLQNGEEVTAHYAFGGNSQAETNSKVLLSVQNNIRARFSHQVEIIYTGRVAIGVHAGRSAEVLYEAICHNKIQQLTGYATLRKPEKASRQNCINLILEGNGLRSCHIVTKSITLAVDGIAYYPDPLTLYNINELIKLTNIVREGQRAMIFLLAQRSDTESFRPADHINPEYCNAFRDAVARGVELLAYKAKVNRRGIEIDQTLNCDIIH